MSVVCRQTSAGEPDQTYRIEPHAPDQSDADLLAAKASGAADKGWTVEWTGERSFTAAKERWGGVLCVREFWME
jgi:hypothetical protein